MKIFDTSTLDEKMMAILPYQEAAWIYNGLDVCVTAEVYNTLIAQLETEPPNVRATYETALAKLAPIMEMSLRGTLIDEEARQETITSLEADLKSLDAKYQRIMREVFGSEMNWRSPVQLKNLFYGILGLKEIKKRNAQGVFAATVNREALEYFDIYLYARPLASFILAMRDIHKQLGFLKTEIDRDQRIRTTYNIAGTNTGRLASSMSEFGTGTNLQNVNRKLRYPFTADPQMYMVNVDLEQADGRNVGAICHTLFAESDEKQIARLLEVDRWTGPVGAEFASAFLDACESGDLHTSVCRMTWPELLWPEDKTKWKKFCDGLIAHGQDSYRQLAKKLGHGCLTADHEVLTPNGWVSIAEQPSVILQWEKGAASWVSPSHWEAKAYTGTMHEFDGASISAYMTHDHRVPYTLDPTSAKLREQPAEAGPGKFMPLGSGYVGGDVEANGRLMAAIISDGEITGNKTRFNFRKERKVARLIELCKEAGVAYTFHADGRISINMTCRKKLGSWVLQLSPETAWGLLTEYRHWDGHIGETSVTLFSVNRENLEWLQTLGRLYGIGGNIQKPAISGFGSTVYRLQQNNRQWASGNSIRHTQHSVENLMVYCPTVKSGWFFVRRKGKIFVTGNTNYYGTPRTMAKHAHVPTKIIEEFQARYFRQFPAIKAWHNYTINEIQTHGTLTTLFGRRRMFFGRGNDASTWRKAIAYCPQSMTGEQIDRGLLQIWRKFPQVQLLNQVHDSILFQVPFNEAKHLIPEILKTMQVTIELKGGRPFTVPLEAAAGWNWGYADENNKYGLKKWTGQEDRDRPSPKRRLRDYLATAPTSSKAFSSSLKA